jgi:hypothetical protein
MVSLFLIFPCAPGRNQPAHLSSFREDDGYQPPIQLPDRNETLLAMLSLAAGPEEHEIGENVGRIDEVDAMLLKIGEAFSLVPFELH